MSLFGKKVNLADLKGNLPFEPGVHVCTLEDYEVTSDDRGDRIVINLSGKDKSSNRTKYAFSMEVKDDEKSVHNNFNMCLHPFVCLVQDQKVVDDLNNSASLQEAVGKFNAALKDLKAREIKVLFKRGPNYKKSEIIVGPDFYGFAFKQIPCCDVVAGTMLRFVPALDDITTLPAAPAAPANNSGVGL